MTKILSKVFIIIAFAFNTSTAWGADKSPGGKGILKGFECFRTESSTVREVCASYAINWKMWSLMGEPVGSYSVSWSLRSMKLMDPKRGILNTYSAVSIPSELKKSAGALTLYLDGYATTHPGAGYAVVGGAFHRFNTGISVRANAGGSVNVPGSPSWDKLFVDGVIYGCEDKRNTYLSADAAKKKFIAGVELNNFERCAVSAIAELSQLESAIDKLCQRQEADKKYAFCPEQKPIEKMADETNPINDAFAKIENGLVKATKYSGKSNSIEDAFAKLDSEPGKSNTSKIGGIDAEFEKVEAFRAEQIRLKAEVAAAKARREEAVQYCDVVGRTLESCSLDSCGVEPSTKEVCTATKEIKPEYSPCTGPVGTRCIVFSRFECIERGANPAYSKWQSCTIDVKSKCKGDRPTRSVCVSQRQEETRRTSAPDAPILEKLKKKLRDSVKCNPDSVEKCPAQRTVGSIRG